MEEGSPVILTYQSSNGESGSLVSLGSLESIELFLLVQSMVCVLIFSAVTFTTIKGGE